MKIIIKRYDNTFNQIKESKQDKTNYNRFHFQTARHAHMHYAR
jgi:diadenosine tetraphosphate (Ap4A) HIT family hydrolase